MGVRTFRLGAEGLRVRLRLWIPDLGFKNVRMGFKNVLGFKSVENEGTVSMPVRLPLRVVLGFKTGFGDLKRDLGFEKAPSRCR